MLKGPRERLNTKELKKFRSVVDSYVNQSNFAAQHNFSQVLTNKLYKSDKPVVVSRDTANFVRGVIRG